MDNNRKQCLGLYEKALPDNLSWEEKFSIAANAGFNFMEISIDDTDKRLERLKWDRIKRNKLSKISKSFSVPVLTMCLSATRRFPIGCSNKSICKKGIEIITDAVRFCSELGIRLIQIGGYYKLSQEKTTDATIENFTTNLKKCVDFAASQGVMIGLENVDNEFSDSLDKLYYHIKNIKSPWLQLYADFGNLIAMRQDAQKQLKTYIGNIAALHIKDTIEGVTRNISFGKGIVDFVSIFTVLKDLNFKGPMIMEMWADNNKDNAKIIGQARNWVIDKLKEANF